MRYAPNHRLLTTLLPLLFLAIPLTAGAYPIDAFEQTGIRRLAYVNQVLAGKVKGNPIPKGATLPSGAITLHLTGRPDLSLADPRTLLDSGLQSQILALFPDLHESYSIAVMDISPGQEPRLALHQAERRFIVGSVGKLAVAAGLFAELARIYPEEPAKRQELLRTRMVTAGPWVETDHHPVPIFDPATDAFESRQARPGDVFSLYEWTDHMISASANSAASVVWKEAVLLRHFQKAYPPSPEEEEAFFATTPRQKVTALAMAVVNDPLTAVGLSREDFHLGSLFTAQGKKRISGEGDSKATPLGLMRYLVALEQGRLVDPWSSLEIKRLMYTTAKRIRYVSAPSLSRAAVYFKSGSLYSCTPEPGFSCKKYMGNKENVMNSVAIVEEGSRVYLVTLMTNVLRKNSAVDHQTLGTRIHRIFLP